MLSLPYREVWALDTEFNLRPTATHTFPAAPQPEGSIQHPVCLVARELYSGRVVELFEDEFDPTPPFDLGSDVLFIAYNAVAEWLTFLALGWNLPCRVLDAYIEYRRHICGTRYDTREKGNKSFLKALEHFNVPTKVTADLKTEERDFVLRGGPWTEAADRRRILDYCDTDVQPLFRLVEHLLHDDCCGEPLRSSPIGLAQAVHRGRFSLAAARMEHNAFTVDTDLLDPVRAAWGFIRGAAIEELDEFGVYRDGHFSNTRFLEYVGTLGIPWPRAESGLPKLDKGVFEDMAQHHPQIAPIRDLRCRLSEIQPEKLRIGADDRNRASCMMFGTKTGRNAPSQNGYLFGLPTWMRHFLKPQPGWAMAYLDYRNQEFHIAGVLSEDAELLAVLATPDPYMDFAIRAGLAPAGATKRSHPEIRAVCKTLLLGTNYGMGVELFGFRANIPIERAEHIHAKLKRTFSRYFEWSSEVVREARAGHWLHTVFGWRQFMDQSVALSVRNFPMQANGAEMTRLACCLATERGVRVCSSIHDALLVEAPLGDIDDAVTTSRAAMEEASREVLEGYTVPVDVEIVRWPDRFRPDKGRDMWERVLRLAGVAEGTGVGGGVGGGGQ